MTMVTSLLLHVTLFVNVPIEHTIPLGSMAINSISKLTQLNQSSLYSLPNAPTLADLEDDTQEGNWTGFCFELEISLLVSIL